MQKESQQLWQNVSCYTLIATGRENQVPQSPRDEWGTRKEQILTNLSIKCTKNAQEKYSLSLKVNVTCHPINRKCNKKTKW